MGRVSLLKVDLAMSGMSLPSGTFSSPSHNIGTPVAKIPLWIGYLCPSLTTGPVEGIRICISTSNFRLFKLYIWSMRTPNLIDSFCKVSPRILRTWLSVVPLITFKKHRVKY
ncbi:hypothetical protein AVEN_200315-1 [Araneus ventricosus]|uniref:Uncharacterized protein n=1 Tax=Araneus ventricosus TaxID=182803 RepID=A0A4Y2M4H9_ARAVE|nr:hypothetical protein AVEN_200315-1 [Araneus ventricosus]